jgi:hypothetical protein
MLQQQHYPSLPQQFQTSSQTNISCMLNKLNSCGESTAVTCSSTSESSTASPSPALYNYSREDEWLDCTTNVLENNNDSFSNPPLEWVMETDPALFDVTAGDETATSLAKTAVRAAMVADAPHSSKKTKMDPLFACTIPQVTVDDLENLVVAQQESFLNTTCNLDADEEMTHNNGLSDLTQALNQMTLQEREKVSIVSWLSGMMQCMLLVLFSKLMVLY